MAHLKARWRSLAVLALAVAVVVGFAWRGGPAAAVEVPSFKAGDIADAVLFNDGPAAGYLSGLRRPPFQWNEELREIQRGIRTAVEDPRFATGFATRMQSGDPRQCQSAMLDLGLVARRVLYDRYGAQRVDQLAKAVDGAFAEERLLRAAVLNHEFSLDTDINTHIDFDVVLVSDFSRDTSWHVDIAVLVDTAVDAVTSATLVLATIDVFNLPMEHSERSQLAAEVLIDHLASDLRAGTPR